MKYVQTSGKSNFKKIIAIFEKNDKITEQHKDKIIGIFKIYKDRELEYLESIALALESLKKKYLEEAKADAQKEKEDILKEKDRAEKERLREENRARKNYWKNRNLE